jgi:hypothetical protein
LSEALGYSEHTAAAVQDERWALVHRVVSSRHLLKSPQLRDILLYLAHRVLDDNASAIGEQEIGCKVLGRRPDFSPNEDNIVRVQVRRLRGKLEEYFSSDGADEPLVVSIPKGAYLLSFEPRHAPPASSLGDATALGDAAPRNGALVPAARKAPIPWPAWLTAPRIAIAALTVLVAALAFSTVLLWRQREVLQRAPAADEAQMRRGEALWSKVFVPGRETNIVIADSCLVVIQDILKVDIPLTEYLSGAYPDKLIQSAPSKELRAALRLIADRQYTSLGDANIAPKFMDLSRRYATQANIRYPRFMSVRDSVGATVRAAIELRSRRGSPDRQVLLP